MDMGSCRVLMRWQHSRYAGCWHRILSTSARGSTPLSMPCLAWLHRESAPSMGQLFAWTCEERSLAEDGDMPSASRALVSSPSNGEASIPVTLGSSRGRGDECQKSMKLWCAHAKKHSHTVAKASRCMRGTTRCLRVFLGAVHKFSERGIARSS